MTFQKEQVIMQDPALQAAKQPDKPSYLRALRRSAVSALMTTSLLFSLPSHAQFDELPPPPVEDFSEPPPADLLAPAPIPTPVTIPGRPGLGRGESIIGPSGSGKSGILDKNQKEKFARANPEDINGENFPETIESFDFPNVEITDVIKAISELTGKNFIIDSTVRGKITILAPSKITVAEAYKAFLSALAINGFTVVPSGGFLKIRNARSAQRDNIDTYSGAYYPNSDQMITKIIHLKHITADTVQKDLRLLTSSYGEMSAFGQTNSLIISDFGANIDRVMKIINQLDVPGFEDQLEVIGIKYAKAKDIAELIDKVVNKGQKSQTAAPGGFAAGVPRFGATTNTATNGKQGAAYFLVFPEDRTNSLVVVGNKAGIQRVKKLIGQLDFKVKAEDQGGVYVYYVKNGKAEDIAATLSDVAKDAGSKSASPSGPTGGLGLAPQGQAAAREGLFGGDVSIKADKNTNSLVVSASKQDYEKVLSIIAKLDIPRDQVFVSAIIMEMSLKDDFDQSAGIVAFGKEGGKTGFTSKSTDPAEILNPLGGGGSAVLSFAQGSVSVTDPLTQKAVTVPNLFAYLKFLKGFGKTNILSTPQITATDSKKAEIEVGEKVVTSTKIAVSQNAPTVEEPTLEDATIKMTLTPYLSPDSDDIRMEFKQQVKQLGTSSVPSRLADRVQPLATRSIDTNVNVRNGDTAVIGGLIRDQQSENTVKVPLLGDLPIVGWLFKGKTVKKEKVNMLVFLTPQILRSRQDQLKLLNSKEAERLNFIKQQGGKDAFGSTMDKIMGRNRTPNSTGTEVK